MKKKQQPFDQTADLAGKRVAITGATGGIGVELCRHLLLRNAKLILINRNIQKATRLKETLLSEYKNAEISLLTADMEDIASVETVCVQLEKSGFDYLYLNAGAYAIGRHKCSTGYDNVFQIDFASPYYMVERLLPYMHAVNARVIAVGSIAHNYSKTDPLDMDFSDRTACNKVYGNAKRYLMFSLDELFKDEHSATLSIVHPGITFTGITDHYPKWLFFIIKNPMKIIFMKPKKAALCLLAGAYVPTAYKEWIGPRFFDIWGNPKKKRLNTCCDNERRQIAENAKSVYRHCRDKRI